MKPDPDKPYYTAYDKRYRSVYSQGVRYWSADPSELSAVEVSVRRFLDSFRLRRDSETEIIEFGCGEGFVGDLLARSGFRYTGIELAPSAAGKATERLARHGRRATILNADILDLSTIPDDTFDAGIDVGCIHMLVVDAHRTRYLQNAFRVLKSGSPMVFSHAGYDSEAPSAIIRTYEEWIELSGTDCETPQRREAWEDGESRMIEIPLIAARRRSLDQYRAEMEFAGFEVVAWNTADCAFGVSFSVRKPQG